MAYPNRPPPPPPTVGQTMGSTNIEFVTEIRFDSSYFKTLTGILRCILLVFNSIGIICITSSAFSRDPRGVFFVVICMLSLIYTGVITVAYVFHVVEKYHKWHWLKMEMFTCIALVFLNMITSSIVVATNSAAYNAAGFFGYLCMVLYGVETFTRARTITSGAPAQGLVVTTKQNHVTSPS